MREPVEARIEIYFLFWFFEMLDEVLRCSPKRGSKYIDLESMLVNAHPYGQPGYSPPPRAL